MLAGKRRKPKGSSGALLACGFPRGEATGDMHKARERIRQLAGSCNEHCSNLLETNLDVLRRLFWS